jgi:hypothetical protein
MAMREGISVVIEGSSPAGNSATIDYHYYGPDLPPQAGAHASMRKRYYFDLRIVGLKGGTATVRISHLSVEAGCKIQHWDGAKWADHGEAVVDAKNATVTARFDVSQLGKTPIVIGTT